MIKRRSTLLILGAGASKEANFPLGFELRDQLASMLEIGFEFGGGQTTGDRALGQYILGLARRDHALAQRLQDAARMVARKLSQVPSIDALLSILPSDEAVTIAKVAIVAAITRAEKNSFVYLDDTKQYDSAYFSRMSKTWYGKFFELLHERAKRTDVDRMFDQLIIVTFNYDRSFEEFLFRSLINLYDMSNEAAADAMKRLRIIHPYGQIAPLDWQERGGVRYGSLPLLDDAPKTIRTFSEQLAKEHLQSEIHEAIRWSECIVFLGFGFLDENMDLLTPDIQIPRKPLRGTAMGFSTSNRDHVESKLETWLESYDMMHATELNDPAIKLHDLTCGAFVDQFSRFIRA